VTVSLHGFFSPQFLRYQKIWQIFPQQIAELVKIALEKTKIFPIFVVEKWPKFARFWKKKVFRLSDFHDKFQ
jgi:hypothetical protein